MKRTAVLNVVGLTPALLGTHTPQMTRFAARSVTASLRPAFPAVTCTAQSNYLTGRLPREHGIVGNGWYDRSLAEVQFWRQSNHLVQAPKIWDELRRQSPDFTCAQLFWWYNMYSTAEYSITPRPLYPADGRKVFDIHTWPYGIRSQIKRDLGEFPFPAFWGPAAGVKAGPFSPDAASRWIAQSARWIEEKYGPTLSLVYLPHLDYNLQRLGPDHPAIAGDLAQIDQIVGELISFYENRAIQVFLLSEYGITAVDQPIHVNRLFRKHEWLAIKDELGLEVMDCGASRIFAVADHQIAHIYLNDPPLGKEVRHLLESTPGVAEVWGAAEKTAHGLDHPRAGDLIAVGAEKAWFTYYYWMDDAVAPDFARTVDIHRKPGYDPVELFLNPQDRLVKLRIAARLAQRRLGMRMLMDVIPLDANLVRGSHGRISQDRRAQPVLIGPRGSSMPSEGLDSTAVYGILRDAVIRGAC